jgi:hypothetical protein
MIDMDAAVLASIIIAEFAAPVGRAIVNEQQFDVFVTLADYAFYARNQLRLAVVYRSNYAYQAGYQGAAKPKELLFELP